MSKVDMSPEAVTRRLREVARLSDLRTQNRLATKVDMSPEGVTRRLRRQAELTRACLKWRKIGEENGLGRARRGSTT